MRPTRRLAFFMLLSVFALSAFTGSALAAPPANDNFADARVLEAGKKIALAGSFTDATREVDEPLVSGSDTDHTLWYRWKAKITGTLRVSSCSSNSTPSDESVAIYSGSSLGSLTVADSGANNCGAGNSNARAQTSVTAGQYYYIQIGSPTTIAPDPNVYFHVDFATLPPANDSFAAAQIISAALPTTISVDNSLATIEAGEPNAAVDSETSTVWFKWTAPANMDVAVDTCASSERAWEPDSKLYVYAEGPTPALADLSAVNSNDDGCSGNNYMSYVAFTATLGETYWIRLGNYANQYGSEYKLRLREVGELTNLAPPTVADNVIAPGGTLNSSNGRWDSSTSITFQRAWQRCDLDGENCEEVVGETTGNLVTTAGDVDHTFRFVVTATDSSTSLTLTSLASRPVASPPGNDLIANATDLGSALPTSIVDDNHLGDVEVDELGVHNLAAAKTVWFRWTAPTSEKVVIDLCKSTGRPDADANFVIGVYTGDGTIAGSSRVGMANYGCGSPGRPSIVIEAVQGMSYWVQVDTPSSSSGSFKLAFNKLKVDLPPAPAATDPVPAFKLAKLGTVKPSRKGAVNLKKLNVICGAGATGNCGGKLTIKTAKKKVGGKTVKSVSQTFKLSAAPGAKAGTSYKLSKKLIAALKKAKKLSAKVSVTFGGPGFTSKSASTSLTLKN